MKRNDWQKRFGAARRALDRKLLVEWERNYGDMPLEGPTLAREDPIVFEAPKTAPIDRNAIARAFGRPLN